jgi:hypothetical protein
MLKEDIVKIHPSSLVLFSRYYSDNGESYSHGNSTLHKLKKINSNQLSISSTKKLTRAITYMAHVVPDKKMYNPKFNSTFKFRLSFITLTLSYRQQHDDTLIKNELLSPFLEWLQKVWHIQFYVWKAERQKNMNIHFHLIIDKYVPYGAIREQWNKYQSKLGYISNYWNQQPSKRGVPVNLRDQFAVNSTDIHSTRKIKDLKRYLCKYMVKNDTSNRIRLKRTAWNWKNTNDLDRNKYSATAKELLKNYKGIGRIWGCSHNLTNLKGASDQLDLELISEIDTICQNKHVYVKNESYFKYICFDYSILKDLGLHRLKKLLDDYCTQLFPAKAAV